MIKKLDEVQCICIAAVVLLAGFLGYWWVDHFSGNSFAGVKPVIIYLSVGLAALFGFIGLFLFLKNRKRSKL